ncbi:hypothetical protein [Methanothrix sp.]|uniref:hypothetical protein n=1 Tax=Methanothrix sp. TaxID=90426 RepID=UPI003C71DA42
MGFKSVVMGLLLAACLSAAALGAGPLNAVAQFPAEEMSGSVIKQEVQEGFSSLGGDPSLSFRNESLFYTDRQTGMSPNAVTKVPVRYAAIAGNWSFSLTGAATSHLTLNLYQNQDAVSGYGVITQNGAMAQVTAAGTILGDRVALFVTPVASQSLYRLSLTITPGSLNGDFIYTAPGVTQPGVAFGKLLAASPAAPVALGA